MTQPRAPIQWITTENGLSYVQIAVDPDWVSFARIAPQDGNPVIAELRMVPAAVAATWDGPPPDWIGTPPVSPLPSGGLLAKHLKRLPVYAHLDQPASVRRWRDREGRNVTVALTGVQATGSIGSLGATVLPARRRGRPVTTFEADYAAIARDYAAAMTSGSRTPITDVAGKRKLQVAVVRNRVANARTLGFLTGRHAGRPGGTLTAAAKAVLARAKRTIT